MARILAERIEAHPRLELVVPPTLSIVCFRYLPERSETSLDAFNKMLMEHVQADGEAFVTQAIVDGQFTLRVNVLHPGTFESDLDALIEEVVRIGGTIDRG
jgi:glutamate/tyrosine decarboxylase-like PLP-dependent enzyme